MLLMRKRQKVPFRSGRDLGLVQANQKSRFADLMWSCVIPMAGSQIFTHNPTGLQSHSVPAVWSPSSVLLLGVWRWTSISTQMDDNPGKLTDA